MQTAADMCLTVRSLLEQLRLNMRMMHADVQVLHLHPTFQIHSVRGRLEAWSIQASQHLCNDCIDVNIVQPAVGKLGI